MMLQNKPLSEVIREHLHDGELPESFSLPKDENTDPNSVQWADGAFDGVGMYHMSRPEITDAHISMIAYAFDALRDHKEAAQRMKALFAKRSPLSVIDAIQHYILEHTDSLAAEDVFSFAADCLNSADADLVKLGLILIEIFREPEDAVKDVIRILGHSDEFTLYALFSMRRWKNGNSEVFALAKKVHGWGRIHAVEYLEPETQEIRDWLLAEGIRNNIVPDYSALDVYQKAEITSLLHTSVTDMQLDRIAAVLYAMFQEGPVRGISALPENEAAEMIGDFLRQAETHTMTLDIGNLILTISGDERFQDYHETCTALLHSSRCSAMIEHALDHGEGVYLAKAAGVPYEARLLAHMRADFATGWFNAHHLLEHETCREQVLDIFRKALPLQSMTGNPTLNRGWGAENENYRKLDYLIQSLANYPLCGTDLVCAGLRMPVFPCRVQALRTISAWCSKKGCTLAVLSQELYDAAAYLKTVEVDDGIRKMIADLGV